MLRLIWRETAREEARAVFRYIAEHDVGAAHRLITAIEACAERLPEHPYMYRPAGLPARAKRSCIRTIS